TLSDAIGNMTLNGGTIQGGVIDVAPGSAARLIVNSSSSNQFTGGVTVNGGLDLTQVSGASVRISGGLTLNTTLQLRAANGSTAGNLYFNDVQSTLRTDTTGTIVLGTRAGGNQVVQ